MEVSQKKIVLDELKKQGKQAIAPADDEILANASEKTHPYQLAEPVNLDLD